MKDEYFDHEIPIYVPRIAQTLRSMFNYAKILFERSGPGYMYKEMQFSL